MNLLPTLCIGQPCVKCIRKLFAPSMEIDQRNENADNAGPSAAFNVMPNVKEKDLQIKVAKRLTVL